MADLTTQPYKGAKDYYPVDMRVQNYIFKVWRTVVERYGYEEYTAPLIELTDLYRAKTGEEIVNEQTYTFTDRGGREVTIRPEMTPSVARMVAVRQQELSYPLRWYSIVNNWRYERPQRGRAREFWQLNVDLIGASGIEADAEVIRIADNIMRAFGASDEMFTIRINSRKLTSLIMGEFLELDVQKSHLLSKLLDRKSKMSESAFATQVKTIVGEDAAKLTDLLNVDDIDKLPANIVESGQVEELRRLFSILKEGGVTNLKFDLTLMRGFDYYTGVVFEVFDTNPENPRALFGGGRFDELTAIFGVPEVPAVGFAPGDVGTANFLETHQLLPKLQSTTRVYVAVLGEQLEAAQKLASSLRKAGINVAVDAGGRKAETQIKKAIKDEIPFVLFVGEQEAKSGKYTLKELATESEAKLNLDELTQQLQ